MGFSPRDVARAGRKVYERHRADLERHHRGHFVLIDIRSERIYLADSPEGAYRKASAERVVKGRYPLRVGGQNCITCRKIANSPR